MKKIIRNSLIVVLAVFATSIIVPSCGEDSPIDINDTVDFVLGWLGDSEIANLPFLEQDINLGATNSSSGNLPSSVDLTAHFPPIGDQGSYGTCVAWACAYNLKTYLEGKDKGLSSNDLASTSNQFSPKDLFWAIPESDKGTECGGTGFEYALDKMVLRGVAKMNTVPYDELGDCSEGTSSSWDNEAAQYKLENYRKIDFSSVSTLKDYLANNRPVVIGAQLGDGFMSWDSDDIIDTDSETYNGQHAYHAMILSGYDDNKGTGAFRVVNSWGNTWGDVGYIWVDYDFFVTSFCFAAFVATNANSDPTYDPDTINDVSGYDVIGWELEDFDDEYETDGTFRVCGYNVYNIGETPIPASMNWNILYLVYDAYDANNYEILLYDYYTVDYGPGVGDLGAYDPPEFPGRSGNWYNNIDIPSGESVSDVYFDTIDSRFLYYYQMPTIPDGDYYLVMIADGYDVIDEYDESNNYLYFTNNGEPISITNSVIDDFGLKNLGIKPTRKPYKGDRSPNGDMRNRRNVNTYSPQDITKMIKNHYETGEMQNKINDYLGRTANSKGKVRG